jgi:hypothetical protein
MRWMYFPALFAALFFTGCEVRRPPESQEAQPATPVVVGTPSMVHIADIGDVEASIRIEGFMAEPDIPAGVTVDSLETPRQTLSLCTIEVSGSATGALWLTFQVVPGRFFDGQPLAVRGAVLREQGMPAEPAESIHEFQALFAQSGDQSSFPEPLVFRVNALEGLDTRPETMLLHATMEVLLLPKETDTATVDPATVSTDPNRTSNMLSNPIRINFSLEEAGS